MKQVSNLDLCFHKFKLFLHSIKYLTPQMIPLPFRLHPAFNSAFFISLLLLSANSSFSQDARKISLNWVKAGAGEESAAETPILKGAHYPDFFETLPALYFEFPKSGIKASLREASYAPAAKDELKGKEHLISDEPLIRTFELNEKKNARTGIYILPYRRITGGFQRLISFQLETNTAISQESQKLATSSTGSFAATSVLGSGDWYKLVVNAEGIYKIDYPFLIEHGVLVNPVPVDRIRLFGNGGGMLPLINGSPRIDDLRECAIEIVDQDNDGLFGSKDYLLFYGQGPNKWIFNAAEKQYVHQKHLYSDNVFYFITLSDTGTPKRISVSPSLNPSPGDPVITSFTDLAHHEEDKRNFIKSGKGWFGETFDVTLSQKFDFSFPNLVPGTARLRSSVAARTSTSFSSNSRFIVSYNGSTLLTQTIPNVGVSYTDDFARTSVQNTTFNPQGSDIEIQYTFQPYNAGSTGWLDNFSIQVTRALIMSGNELRFRDADTTAGTSPALRTYRVSGAGSSFRLWNLKDHNDVKKQLYSVINDQIEFTQQLNPSENMDYILFNDFSFRRPNFSGKVSNQNLHQLPQADYLIITAPEFKNEAERLGQFRTVNDGFRTHVVTTEEIYNEFSGGAPDIAAIRDFIRMFYTRAGNSTQDIPRYVLLFGDGSYDPKERISGNTNFIPTFQSENSVSLLISYTSDDFFVSLDSAEGTLAGPELVDAGIGRLPVKTTEQAREMVDKIIKYSTPGTVSDQSFCAGGNDIRLGDWRNALCFIADDQDRNLHLRQSERIAASASQNAPGYNIDKIVCDAYQQISTPGGSRYPEVNEAITKRVEKGALLVNYTGHGGELGWASESILNNEMINGWNNSNSLPAFITATCEFSRYDDPQRTSAGEFVLLNPNGGGICLFTTVRLAFAIENELINADLIYRMFNPLNGEMPRAGDIIRLSKIDNPSNRNVTLLGDPALRLSYPLHRVITDSIQEESTGLNVDTLKALNKITIKGHVADINGNTLNSFSGVVYPTIYDKSKWVYTLVNDASGSDISLRDSFLLRSNVVYRGKASVQSGQFSCTFIVPKDISVQYGSGRISYYAHNGNEDAQGYNESIQIGGISGNALQDPTGPRISLYMNDENFINGSITGSSPVLYAVLFDSSGVNTVGNGIGHDITAQLDGKPDNLYVLNEYFESDLNSYQKGRVRFPLENLSEGYHKMTLKAWDINNNSSESMVEFVVTSSASLALERVLNYPNPFSTYTRFMFEHNKACTGMAIQVQIFTVSGKLVKTLDSYQVCEGYRNAPLEWDGRDDFGDPIAKGVYIYCLKIRTAEGETAQKTEKLVLLR